MVPLFPGYLFLHGNHLAYGIALKGNSLVQILKIRDQARLDADLRQIRCMLSTGLSVVSEPTYPVGTPVRIAEGPLRGLVGVVDRRVKGGRFVAAVDFLKQGAAIELGDWQVEPIEVPG